MGSVTRLGSPAQAAQTPEDTSFGRSVVTTKLDQLVNWARAGSLWPLPFGTACCAIEFMSVVSAHYDLSRFGAEVVRFSPRQSDVMIVAGTVTDKQSPIMKQIWEQMAEPKWCIAMGVCASSGGFYRAYHVTQGIDEVIPVDVYVPGCPPTPEGLIYAVLELQRKIQGETRMSDRKRVPGTRPSKVEGLSGSDPTVMAAGPRPGARLLNDPALLGGASGSGLDDRRLRVLPTAESVGPPPQEERGGQGAPNGGGR
ncbi:MAG: NADH-quinone oxidoreductase subunit NuoB [Gemmatimonadetes bacterium]|nr:NADH-quinone oxidoreductase subunit NuoB [Gemmatimonadota bacterium]